MELDLRMRGIPAADAATWTSPEEYPLVLQNAEDGVILETTMTRAILVSEADTILDEFDYWDNGGM